MNTTTNRELKDYSELLMFGTDTDFSEDRYWHHLIVNSTTTVFAPLEVYVQAVTSGLTSTYDDYLVTVEVVEGPNFPPAFKGLRTTIVLDWAGEELLQTYKLP